jgi:hypothetical protein
VCAPIFYSTFLIERFQVNKIKASHIKKINEKVELDFNSNLELEFENFV